MKTKDVFFLIFMGILAGCALVFTGLIVKDRLFSSHTSSQTAARRQAPQQRHISSWQNLHLTGYRKGSPEAPVRIVEFFDYQCPYCKRAKPVVKAIRKKYPNKVAVVYEDNPLPMHEHAREAAIAAECVRRTAPNSFMAYHDSLFAHQHMLGVPFYSNMAKQVSVANFSSWQKCMDSKQTAGILEAGKELAGKLGIRGIPSFLINGTLVSEQQFDELIQEALARVDD